MWHPFQVNICSSGNLVRSSSPLINRLCHISAYGLDLYMYVCMYIYIHTCMHAYIVFFHATADLGYLCGHIFQVNVCSAANLERSSPSLAFSIVIGIFITVNYNIR